MEFSGWHGSGLIRGPFWKLQRKRRGAKTGTRHSVLGCQGSKQAIPAPDPGELREKGRDRGHMTIMLEETEGGPQKTGNGGPGFRV